VRKVVLTGASGFVGRAVCRSLVEHGWSVRAACRAPVEAPSRGEVFATGDLRAFRSWGLLLEGAEAVVHLANAAHVRARSAEQLADARALNVEATLRLAEAAAASGVRRFLYLSSSKVHGEETFTRAIDEASPFAPVDPYASLKVEAENGLRRIAADGGLQLMVLRPPLVYGPGVKANFLALMRLVASRLPLPFGSIQNRRSLIFVGNLAHAVAQCLGHAASCTFLVSDDGALSTPELCRALGGALGRPAWLFGCPPGWLESIPGMKKMTRSFEVDASAIRRSLDWRAPYSVEQGLRATADWYLGKPATEGR
jgi:nucleoside-diphosphate-sugar epimerase